MKLDKLKAMSARLGCTPDIGTGRNGAVLARDYERAIALHHLAASGNPMSWGMRFRMSMETPMLAKSAKQLRDKGEQALLSEDYVAEEKLNGVRMLCCIDNEGNVEFIGRNISDKNCVPLDYTGKIAVRVDDLPPSEQRKYINTLTVPFTRYSAVQGVVLDMEVTADAGAELCGGNFSESSLNSVVSILSRSAEAAIAEQCFTPLTCTVFDVLYLNVSLVDSPYYERREALQSIAHLLPFPVHVAHHLGDKRELLRAVLARGGEGLVLKRRDSLYSTSPNRCDDWIKVKRTVSGTIAEDMDGFILEVFHTPEWSKRLDVTGKPLIGGIKLGVYLIAPDGKRTRHHIASVTSMPDTWRQLLTADSHIGRVLTFDGMDVSARNRRLSHATVDWSRGFRDKRAEHCILLEDDLNNQIF